MRLLGPQHDDYAVVKPKHSGFYATPLELLLTHLGARSLVLTGLAGDACVLLTAADAYLRAYRLFVPGDCVASADRDANLTGAVCTCGGCSGLTSDPAPPA